MFRRHGLSGDNLLQLLLTVLREQFGYGAKRVIHYLK